jgi:transcriptional regulator with XRE-family HTH domain
MDHRSARPDSLGSHAFAFTAFREFRRKWGLSQHAMARKLGCSQSYISKLENGQIEAPDIRYLQQFANTLEVPLTTLIHHPHAAKEGAAAVLDRMPQLKVFICHASSDKPAARELYQRLKGEGFVPWLDEEDLLPGQNWKRAIPKAVSDSHVVVVCLSGAAVNRQGFVQKEIGYALDVAAEQPEDTIFIIPVRLEECAVPDRLSEWQWVNLYEPRGYELLLRALRHRAESLQGMPLKAPESV